MLFWGSSETRHTHVIIEVMPPQNKPVSGFPSSAKRLCVFWTMLADPCHWRTARGMCRAGYDTCPEGADCFAALKDCLFVHGP